MTPKISEVIEGAELPKDHAVPYPLPGGVYDGSIEPTGTLLAFSQEAWLRVPHAVRRSLLEGDW